MSDIFKLIRANIERNRDNERQDEQKLALPNTQKRIDIEDFIIGEEERKPQTSLPPNKKKKSVEMDEIDLIEKEIGNDFDTKNYLSDIEQVDYIKLDKMPKDKQLRLLKKEYLVLLDKIKEVSSEFSKVDKSYKEQNVDFHTTKKHYAKLKEFVRNISTLIPDGTDLKTQLEAPNWRLDDVEDEMISRLNFAFNRAKNADTYLEQETAELTTQIQGLKNKITKVENRNLELEQLAEDLNNQISDLNYQLENAVFPSEEEDADDYNDEYDDNYNSNDKYDDNYEDNEEDEDTYYPQDESDEEDYQKPHKEEINEEFDKRYKDEYGFEDDDEEELPPPPKKQPVQKLERKPQQREQRTQEAPVRKEPSERNNNRHENTKPQRNREEERQPNRPKQNDRNERPTNERPKREERPNNERPKREERVNNERPKREERPQQNPRNDRQNDKPQREQNSRNNAEDRPNHNQQKPPHDSRENRNSNQKPNPPERNRENPKNTHPNERPKNEDSRRNRDNEQRPKSDERPRNPRNDRQNDKPTQEKPTREKPQRPTNDKSQRPTPARPTKNQPVNTEPELEEIKAIPLEKDTSYDPNQAVDVDPYLDSLSEEAKYIIRLVGEMGVSRNGELKDALTTREDAKPYFFSGTKFQKNAMNNAVNDLINAQILTNEQINLGSRGSIFKIYELEDLGKHIYFALTNEIPVKSELSQLKRQHKSAEHGFLIKDSADIFKEMGYTVYTSRKDLRHDLDGDNGKRKDFDIIIEKDGVKSYIEVERGTHNDEDFYKAMDKIRQITEEFYFICPNEEILFNKTKRQFFMWIQKHLGGMEQARGIKANFTTFGKLKEGKKPIWDDIEL